MSTTSNPSVPRPISATERADVEIVIPTIGRPSLGALLQDLEASFAACGVAPRRVIVVDDRSAVDAPPLQTCGCGPATELLVLRSGGGGPAAARNVGWRSVRATWTAFVDDDVRVPPDWFGEVVRDITSCNPTVAATQGRLVVPLKNGSTPTDWQRNVSGLADARYITADLAVRTDVLRSCDGFDERFRSAYREDVELALRMLRAGYDVVWGSRTAEHPVRPAPWWISIAKQSGNADDALLRALHGRRWRETAESAPGARVNHLTISALAAAALASAAVGQRGMTAVAAGSCGAMVGRFAWQRIAPGPRDAREIAAMAATSIAIPFVATAQWLRGSFRWRGAAPKPSPAPPSCSSGAPVAPPAAVPSGVAQR